MRVNVYSIKDVISQMINGLYCAPTDPAMVRSLLPALQQNKIPLSQHTLYRIGEFDNDTNELIPSSPVLVPWSCYSEPVEVKAQKITEQQFADSVSDINSRS